jgi:hypothetical protein
MSLLVIDFNYLLGRDGEIVVKELAFVDRQDNRISTYFFKSPYDWEEIPAFTRKMNIAIDHGCNWDDGHILYSELDNVLQREISSTVAIYCLGAMKAEFISSLISNTVIDITQLGCPRLIDINLPTFSCSLPCHNRLKYDCALRSAYSIAQWLNFKMLAEQYVKCPSQPGYH